MVRTRLLYLVDVLSSVGLLLPIPLISATGTLSVSESKCRVLSKEDQNVNSIVVQNWLGHSLPADIRDFPGSFAPDASWGDQENTHPTTKYPASGSNRICYLTYSSPDERTVNP